MDDCAGRFGILLPAPLKSDTMDDMGFIWILIAVFIGVVIGMLWAAEEE